MLTWPLHCQWHFRKGQGKLHTDTHTHIHKLPLPVGNYTLSFHIRTGASLKSHIWKSSARIIQQSKCMNLFEMHRIVCPLAFSSPQQSSTNLTVWLFSEIQYAESETVRPTGLWNYCMQVSIHMSSLVSPRWLSGPAGIIDHPSAHYHTEWRSHPSYETQDDPEHWISVLGLISCPNWPIVYQRGFCTFHCLLSTDEDAQPVQKKKKNALWCTANDPIHSHFSLTLNFYEARKRKDRHSQGSLYKYCHRDLESVTVLLQCW